HSGQPDEVAVGPEAIGAVIVADRRGAGGGDDRPAGERRAQSTPVLGRGRFGALGQRDRDGPMAPGTAHGVDAGRDLARPGRAGARIGRSLIVDAVGRHFISPVRSPPRSRPSSRGRGKVRSAPMPSCSNSLVTQYVELPTRDSVSSWSWASTYMSS